MYRLKNFKSQRMAQRHGEAIGAFVQGQPKVAIAKLKELARDAPLAPQVYSSLGMVYQDMLQSLQRTTTEEKKGDNDQSLDESNRSETGVSNSLEVGNGVENSRPQQQEQLESEATSKIPGLIDQRVKEVLNLGKKAYGSFHLAAILCKQDYTLWVRAAGLALDLADTHERCVLEYARCSYSPNKQKTYSFLSFAYAEYRSAWMSPKVCRNGTFKSARVGYPRPGTTTTLPTSSSQTKTRLPRNLRGII